MATATLFSSLYCVLIYKDGELHEGLAAGLTLERALHRANFYNELSDGDGYKAVVRPISVSVLGNVKGGA
jgi:hypothetical protein